MGWSGGGSSAASGDFLRWADAGGGELGGINRSVHVDLHDRFGRSIGGGIGHGEDFAGEGPVIGGAVAGGLILDDVLAVTGAFGELDIAADLGGEDAGGGP